MFSRRRFLQLSATIGATSLLPKAFAIGAKSKLSLVQLSHKGTWNIRPTALTRLAQFLEDRTTLDPQPTPITISLSSKNFFDFPVMILTGEGKFPALTELERARLAAFLNAGGFLWIDNAEARPSGDFDTSVREELSKALPRNPFTPIDPKHTLFKSFYLIDRPVGRVATTSTLEGITKDGRLAVVFTQNDVLGAYERDSSGDWTNDVTPGGEAQRDKAFRLGINIFMYALCLSYKSDAVHVDYLLKRRDWRGDE